MRSSIAQPPRLPFWTTRTAWLAATALMLPSLLTALSQTTFTRVTTGPIVTDGGDFNVGN